MKSKFFKQAVSLFLCVLLIVSLSVCAFASSEKNTKIDAIAHRGYSACAPENTLAAFRLAGEEGYYGCELDVHPTKDKRWVVMHDTTVDRMTDGSGNVSELTYAEISALKIDSGNRIEDYPDEKVPTLEEALAVCEEYSLRPVIEVKDCSVDDMPSLADLLNNSTFSASYTIISFSRELLVALRALLPETEMWLLTNAVTSSDVSFCKENRIDGISLNYKKNNYLQIKSVLNANLKAVAWTVDNASSAKKLWAFGVSGITTNKLLPSDLEFQSITLGELIVCIMNDYIEILKSFFAKIVRLISFF